MDEIDEWFHTAGEIMESIMDLTEGCEHANEGLIGLCEAAELSEAVIEDKSTEGIIKYFVSGN